MTQSFTSTKSRYQHVATPDLAHHVIPFLAEPVARRDGEHQKAELGDQGAVVPSLDLLERGGGVGRGAREG
jgi:hypothetical protein